MAGPGQHQLVLLRSKLPVSLPIVVPTWVNYANPHSSTPVPGGILAVLCPLPLARYGVEYSKSRGGGDVEQESETCCQLKI